MESIRFGNMFPTDEENAHPYLIDTEPFRICDGLYYVGNLWCASHLIDTGDGLILLDVPTSSGLPGLLINIQRLGYRIEDIRYIVVSHAHVDHYGCVEALKYRTHAKTFMGRVDTEDMLAHPERTAHMEQDLGYYNDPFVPDVQLEDGDVIELGNIRMRCVLTPGHTVGVMSHFWEMNSQGKTLKIGIYGGAGFGALADENIKRNGMPKEMQQAFLTSIDKVWDEEVDLMLGNHPFHSDEYQKFIRQCHGEEDPFVDPAEWHRFLTELRTSYQEFMTYSADEVRAMFVETHLGEYYREIREELMSCIG